MTRNIFFAFTLIVLLSMCRSKERTDARILIENTSSATLDTIFLSVSGRVIEFVNIQPKSTVEKPFDKVLLDRKSRSIVGALGTAKGKHFTASPVIADATKTYLKIQLVVKEDLSSVLTIE
jgi:hypothetical protein